MGALDLRIEVVFFELHQKLMPPWDWEWCLSTQMIVGDAPDVELHHDEDLIFHQHFMVLAPVH